MIRVCLLLITALVISACSNDDAISSVVDRFPNDQVIKMGQLYSAKGPRFPIFQSGIYKYKEGFICWAGFHLDAGKDPSIHSTNNREISFNLIGSDDCAPRTLYSFRGGDFDSAFTLKINRGSLGDVFDYECKSTCITTAYLKSRGSEYFATCSTNNVPGPVKLFGKCRIISEGIFGVIVATTHIANYDDENSYKHSSRSAILSGISSIEYLYKSIKQAGA